jgi:hypothetical protein
MYLGSGLNQKTQLGTAAKNLLLNSRTLVHYNESLPLVLSCDASSYGAGAVLSHVINGKHQPIAFASSTLTEVQRNYSQLEKEAFSIIFGLKRFHQYLCGNSFTILTDHRPLLTLLGPHCSVPAHTASRLQRWALILAHTITRLSTEVQLHMLTLTACPVYLYRKLGALKVNMQNVISLKLVSLLM